MWCMLQCSSLSGNAGYTNAGTAIHLSDRSRCSLAPWAKTRPTHEKCNWDVKQGDQAWKHNTVHKRCCRIRIILTPPSRRLHPLKSAVKQTKTGLCYAVRANGRKSCKTLYNNNSRIQRFSQACKHLRWRVFALILRRWNKEFNNILFRCSALRKLMMPSKESI